MPANQHRGDGLSRANQWLAIPSGVTSGAHFKLTISNKIIDIEATDSEPETVARAWATAISATLFPEWQEVTPSLYTDDLGVVRGLYLTGPSDGTPITISQSTTAATITVDFTTVQDGSAGLNNIQKVTLQNAPTGGTFTWGYNGTNTTALAWNASNATIQTALEAITAIGAGNVTVSGTTGNWTVEFIGARAKTQMNKLEANGSSLTGAGYIYPRTVTNGATTVNYIQKVIGTAGGLTWAGGTCTLYIAGVDSGYLPISAANTQASIQTAMDTLVGSSNCLVKKVTTSTEIYFTFEWTGIYAGIDGTTGAEFVSIFTSLVTITREQEPDPNGIDEVQIYYLLGKPTGGTYTLNFRGTNTAAIAYNASAGTVQTAFQLIATVGSGNALVTGDYLNGFTVTFDATLGASDVPQITGSGASLTGATFEIVHSQDAVASKNEVQSFAFSAVPASGNFKITWNSQQTANIAYNASAATIQAALELLSNIAPNEAIVTGSALGPFTIEFKLTLAAADQNEMTGQNISLAGAGTQAITLTEPITAAGPNHLNQADNWSLGTVPVDADTIILDGAVPIKYSLALSGVDPTLILAMATFTGGLGLEDWNENGYWEYRTKDCSLGTAATLQSWVIGEGEGSGCSLFRVNGGSALVSMRILKTASGTEKPAVRLRGGATGTNSRVQVLRGSFGFCIYEGDTGTLKDLIVSYMDNQDGDSYFQVGSGATLTQLVQEGGSGLLLNSGHKIRMRAGTTEQQRSGWTIAELIMEGGQLSLIGTGTVSLTPELSGNATLSLRPSGLNVSFANPPKVYGDNADIIDPTFSGIITGQTYLDIDYIKTTRFPNLGQNVRIRRTPL